MHFRDADLSDPADRTTIVRLSGLYATGEGVALLVRVVAVQTGRLEDGQDIIVVSDFLGCMQ